MKEKNKFGFVKYLKTILVSGSKTEFYQSAGVDTYRSPQDPVVKAFVSPKISKLKKIIDFKENLKLLDIGCGNGTFTYYFNQNLFTVGVDNSRKMLAQKPEKISAVQADAAKLPFKDNAFDIVFEANMLHHINNDDPIIKETSRLSNKYIVLIEPNKINPLMFLFALLHKPDRKLLKLNIRDLNNKLSSLGYESEKLIRTGMIFQNATPRFFIPLLKIFDIDFIFGAYILSVYKKRKS